MTYPIIFLKSTSIRDIQLTKQMKYTRGPTQKSINLKITYKPWIFPSALSRKMFSRGGQGFSNSGSVSPDNFYSKPKWMCSAARETCILFSSGKKKNQSKLTILEEKGEQNLCSNHPQKLSA